MGWFKSCSSAVRKLSNSLKVSRLSLRKSSLRKHHLHSPHHSSLHRLHLSHATLFLRNSRVRVFSARISTERSEVERSIHNRFLAGVGTTAPPHPVCPAQTSSPTNRRETRNRLALPCKQRGKRTRSSSFSL